MPAPMYSPLFTPTLFSPHTHFLLEPLLELVVFSQQRLDFTLRVQALHSESSRHFWAQSRGPLDLREAPPGVLLPAAMYSPSFTLHAVPEADPELPMSVNIFMHLQHSSSAALALPHLPVTCPAEKSISVASCPQSTSLEKSTQTPKPLCSELQPSSMHWLGGSVVELVPVQLVCCTCGSKI